MTDERTYTLGEQTYTFMEVLQLSSSNIFTNYEIRQAFGVEGDPDYGPNSTPDRAIASEGNDA